MSCVCARASVRCRLLVLAAAAGALRYSGCPFAYGLRLTRTPITVYDPLYTRAHDHRHAPHNTAHIYFIKFRRLTAGLWQGPGGKCLALGLDRRL